MTMNFEKTMLQQISDVAWLVHQNGDKLGILNKGVQETFTFISGRELINFEGEEAVQQHFGNLELFDNKIEYSPKVQDSYYIKGFEIDYPEPFIVEEDNVDYCDDLPLYSKIEGSKVYYAAGYYCIRFNKGWKQARGPKVATLRKYGFKGPFKTAIETRQELKRLNKQG